MSLRFLLDENVHPKVAEAAWEHDVDVASVVDLKRRGRSDLEQLEYAAEHGRVLVTRNRGDYLHWTRELYHARRPHSGVLFVGDGLPNDQPDAIARALRRWAQAWEFDADDEASFGAYHVDFLQ